MSTPLTTKFSPSGHPPRPSGGFSERIPQRPVVDERHRQKAQPGAYRPGGGLPLHEDALHAQDKSAGQMKPFSFDELLARVRALLRRQSEVRNPVLKLDDLTMDTAGKSVQRAGKSWY